MKIFSVITLFCLISLQACIHSNSYYESLSEEVFKSGSTKENIAGSVEYSTLLLRENGACLISEIRNGELYRGGGSWRKTAHENVIEVGLSSNSMMTSYKFYVRLNREEKTYIVSEKLENLLGD
ncbi:MAG: hypothetical protein ACRBHB_06730 [Arenicella sp.]